MPQATVTIAAHGTKTGENAKGTWIKHSVKDNAGTWYETFDQQLGLKAQALKGEQVVLTWEEQQRNGFTNRVLKGVERAQQQTGVTESAQPGVNRILGDPKQSVINRSAALARAISSVEAGLVILEVSPDVGVIEQLFQVADRYVEYIEGKFAAVPPAATPAGSSDSAGENFSDDDIKF